MAILSERSVIRNAAFAKWRLPFRYDETDWLTMTIWPYWQWSGWRRASCKNGLTLVFNEGGMPNFALMIGTFDARFFFYVCIGKRLRWSCRFDRPETKGRNVAAEIKEGLARHRMENR